MSTRDIAQAVREAQTEGALLALLFNFNSTADEHFQADRVSACLELLPEGGCYVNVSYLRGETVLSGEGF